MQEVEIRTGVWFNDRVTKLTFPDTWDIATYWPNTPPPLSDDDIARRMKAPVGQPSLRELARGKLGPVIVVDDLSRPTPVFKIMPHILRELDEAGIESDRVRIVVATGTHGDQNPRALKRKVGGEVFDRCRVLIHNDRKDVKLVGRTSFGTPVYVNKELVRADLIIGVGGVYPQHSTGFGGGGKLALGVLGRKSIKHLHFGHGAVGGNYDIDNDFRRDITEIAQMIGLHTIYTVHTNATMEIVNVMAGDYLAYYQDAVNFSKEKYNAPAPDDADVVIANGYPSDVSFTFMRKANKPILCARAGATKIMVGSNHDGLGHHGLYPQSKSRRYLELKNLFDRISIMPPKTVVRKIFKNLFRRNSSAPSPPVTSSASEPRNDNLWVYVPEGGCTSLPPIEGVTVWDEWQRVLDAISESHGTIDRIKVRIYPCASLQCIDTTQKVCEVVGE